MSHGDAVSRAAPGVSGRERTLTYEPLLRFRENAPTAFSNGGGRERRYLRRRSSVSDLRFVSHLQKKKQKELKESWARWTACLQGQPITAVRLRLRRITTLPFTVAIIAALLLFCCRVAAGVRRRCAHAGAI